MFPLKDDVPAERFPAVNLLLIAANVLVFLYQLTLGRDGMEAFLYDYGFIPARFLDGEGPPLLPVVTSMFLHGNLLHILANMWMLWVFGDNVEDRMGHGRYLFFYLLCGVAAVVVQTWSSPQATVPMVGASGAIAGVLGAYFLLFPGARILTFVPIFIFFYLLEVPAIFFIGFWFFLQFLQGTMQQVATGGASQGGVAWWAHVGGFVGGVVLVRFFARNFRRWRFFAGEGEA
ncbi:MAG TPA: rhomboid family intramembrane serine protease [Desulfurivibrionaceae bacterium]|nr:rhomboid family intramembrane serine protease [Desulfurivibrionaceae bacterium]